MFNAPIGVFDSGLGGLSVVRHIRSLMPEESIHYVGDNAQAPYGPKGADFIRERSELVVSHLVDQGAKAIVVACNTATAAAVDRLRTRFDLPILGMEPAVKPAVEGTRSGIVGVLATEGTLGSRRYANLLNRFGKQVTVVERICHQWVEQVELGNLEGVVVRDLVFREIAALEKSGADTLVLGCTHFPFLKSLIDDCAAPDTKIIDPSFAVARHLKNRLKQEGLDADSGKTGWLFLEFTGLTEQYGSRVRTLFEDRAGISEKTNTDPSSVRVFGLCL